jgi:hypothetical protein
LQNITAHAEGMALYMESMQRKGDDGDRLFGLAMRRFEAAVSSTLDNQVAVHFLRCLLSAVNGTIMGRRFAATGNKKGRR